MPGYKSADIGQRMQTQKKRETMAQVKIQQRQQGAGKFQIRQPKDKKRIPRFAA